MCDKVNHIAVMRDYCKSNCKINQLINRIHWFWQDSIFIPRLIPWTLFYPPPCCSFECASQSFTVSAKSSLRLNPTWSFYASRTEFPDRSKTGEDDKITFRSGRKTDSVLLHTRIRAGLISSSNGLSRFSILEKVLFRAGLLSREGQLMINSILALCNPYHDTFKNYHLVS